MTDNERELVRLEVRAAGRLTRLFRIERSGRFGRRPTDTVRKLIDRRTQLIGELLRMETRRRLVTPRTPADLGSVMDALAQEVARSEQTCQELLGRLATELRLRKERVVTGLRDSADGRLLGRG